MDGFIEGSKGELDWLDAPLFQEEKNQMPQKLNQMSWPVLLLAVFLLAFNPVPAQKNEMPVKPTDKSAIFNDTGSS